MLFPSENKGGGLAPGALRWICIYTQSKMAAKTISVSNLTEHLDFFSHRGFILGGFVAFYLQAL